MQFLVLAKGAKGAACVALIQQVLSNKKLFVFGELLAMPNVQAVRLFYVCVVHHYLYPRLLHRSDFCFCLWRDFLMMVPLILLPTPIQEQSVAHPPVPAFNNQ